MKNRKGNIMSNKAARRAKRKHNGHWKVSQMYGYKVYRQIKYMKDKGWI